MRMAINLMPASCMESLGRRARIRRWVLCYLASAGGMLALWGWAGADLGSMRKELEDLRTEAQRRFEQNEEVQRLLVKQSEAESEIKRYHSLAWPIRVTEVIDAVGEAIPSGVTLNSFMVTPRQVRVTPRAGQEAAPRRSFLVVELEGIAPFDHDVALMVDGIDQNDLFSFVTLEYTRATTIDGTEGRSFRVTCEIDLDTRYRFVPWSERARWSD